jgi:hypothetical protein
LHFFSRARPAAGGLEASGTLQLRVPGGDGSADFKPFITRIAKYALPEGYLVVQLVAPAWDAEQSKDVVWPTAKLRVAGMKFTTAEFFNAVRGEVEKGRAP